MILKRRNRGEAVPEKKLLKKPRTIYISDPDENEEEEEQVLSHTNVADASPSSSSEDELDDEDDDDSEFSDSEDEGTVTRRPVLNNLTNKSSLRCYQPLARIPKNYDPKSILTKKFKIPTMSNNNNSLDNGNVRRTLGIRRRAGHLLRALYDHTAADALVLWDPDKAPVQKEKKVEEVVKKKKEKSLSEILGLKKEEAKQVHITVDPIVSRVLRPHQVEGVKFLFNCTTEKVEPGAFGCIMADEMGLGKTLQCIALVWTLLQQSGELGKPTINKAIVTCPSSLVRNWENEFIKWVGISRVRPLVIDNAGSKEKISSVKRWGAAQGQVVNPILIISYESLRAYSKYLKKSPIGLLLCDEGHRLKNSGSLLFKELNDLPVQRRVILSGTPIQNDLSEYYALLDFANPGLLGTPNEFRKNYEIPILRGRDADASEKERAISDEKVAEFWKIGARFTIRRTNDILSKYLPTKYEHVVFCKLAPLQQALYDVFLTSPEIKSLLRGQGSQPLKAITLLKKLCNHPDLLNLPSDLEGCESVLPSGYLQPGKRVDPSFSGKFVVLARMLAKIKKETNDKIVLISNYTQTLDLFQAYCKQSQYGVLRLDGSMNINKRQKLVDRFNDPSGEEFVFLLSSKAGGCGLNLIGANRLVLFDPDWNPAADQQALARVWRDGQKKDCYIYRFIASGTIEEKIFQRQSHKQSLSNCVVDEATDMERHFSLADMRQLFLLHTASDCETHDTFKCKRCIQGKQHTSAETMNYGDTSSWDHYDSDLLRLPDPLLSSEAHKGLVSYVFQYISHMK